MLSCHHNLIINVNSRCKFATLDLTDFDIQRHIEIFGKLVENSLDDPLIPVIRSGSVFYY